MPVKRCSKCKLPKDLEDFYASKDTKDGKDSWCKKCHQEASNDFFRTQRGLATRIYSSQRYNSKQRSHPMPSYTLKELRAWMFNQSNFNYLYAAWKESGYTTGLKPSVDRIDDYKPYRLSNLRITTWKDNNRRSHEDAKKGINNKQSKAVVQMNLEGRMLNRFYSISAAARSGYAFSQSGISACCCGKRITHAGFKWEFARQKEGTDEQRNQSSGDSGKKK